MKSNLFSKEFYVDARITDSMTSANGNARLLQTTNQITD